MISSHTRFEVYEMTDAATVLVHGSKGEFLFHRNFSDRAAALSYANGECARGRYAVTTDSSPKYN